MFPSQAIASEFLKRALPPRHEIICVAPETRLRQVIENID